MKKFFCVALLTAAIVSVRAESQFPYKIVENNNGLKISVPGSFVSPRGTFNDYFTSNMGNLKIGQTTTWEYIIINTSSLPSTMPVSPVSLTGSSDFTIVNNFCVGVTLSSGQNCKFSVTFAPTTKTAISGEVQVPWTMTYTNPDSTTGTNDGTVFISLNGSGFDKPPQCDETESGSIIGTEKQTLGEYVPLVGVDYGLYYSTVRAPEYLSTMAAFPLTPSFNNEGWTFGVHHSYAPGQSRVFLGTGDFYHSNSIPLAGGNLMVPNTDASEVYIFNSVGRHLETRTGLMGALKYTFGYDGNSRLISITDAFSNQTVITRNGSGQMTSITAPYGQVTTVGINGAGLVSSVTNPMSQSFSMTYKTGTQLLETFTKPGSQVSTFTYDIDGKLTKDLGNGGNFWELIEGASGLVTKESQMGRATNYTRSYDGSGNYGRVQIDPSGLSTTSTEYEVGGYSTSNSIESSTTNTMNDIRFGYIVRRLSSSQRTINSVSATTYYSQNVTHPPAVTPDAFNFATLTNTSDDSGNEVVELFTNSTRTKVTTTEEGATSTVIYNTNEKPVSIQTGSDTATTMTYDANGRLSTTIQGSLNGKTYAYNAAGFLQSITNALSEVTSYAYDLAGRVTSVTLPDTRVIQYGYDSNGNVTSITPPSRPAHNFTFNAFELNDEYQPPTLLGVAVVNTQYAYNMDKQLTQITRPTGATAAYSYNSTTGLLSSITLAGGTDTYSYHSNTPLVSQIDSADGVRTNYTYYGSRVSTEEQRKVSSNFLVGSVSRTFDWMHRLQAITVQGNSPSVSLGTWTTFNGDNKPVQIGNMSLTYSYPSGRLATTTWDKISDSRTYDAYGNLSGYSANYNPTSGPSVLLYSYTLTRDTLHRITSKTETIGGVTDVYDYTYDNSGRLTTVLKNSAAYSSYTYDNNGNRTGTVTSGIAFSSTVDNQDRLLNYGSWTFNYNANGDRIERIIPGSGTNDYTYDALGRLKSLKLTSGTVQSYEYDGNGRLIAHKTGSTVNYRNIYEDDYRILARATDAGVLTQVYQFGTRINTPDGIYRSGWYRYITDHLGSPRLLVRVDNGTIGQRMDYNDVGRVIADSSPGFQAYGFAGGIYLNTENLVKFGARMYDPVAGRWLTKDPIRFRGGDTNLYGYVLNDPINFIDPNGLASVWETHVDPFIQRTNETITKTAGDVVSKPTAGEKCDAIKDGLLEIGKDAGETLNNMVNEIIHPQ